MQRFAYRRSLWLSSFVAAAILIAACNGGGSAPATPTIDAGDDATATATIPEPTSTPVFEGGRDPVEGPGVSESGFPRLVDVRTGRHEGFDRVVFEFDGARPGYRVEYVSQPIIQCGSGFDIDVAGGAFLQVLMELAAAHNDAGTPTFGPQELIPGLPSILEVQSTCDFEGQVTWVLGLTEEVDFLVIELTGPFRIVVDVAHP